MEPTPLATAHARNQRVVEELRKLRGESRDIMDSQPDFANYYPRMIANLQRVYTRLLGATEALQFIGMEGICEVTIKSSTQSLSWQFGGGGGGEVGDALLESLTDQLMEVEEKILEAKGRLAGEYTGGTTEEWHHENVHQLALLLEAVPLLSDSGNGS